MPENIDYSARKPVPKSRNVRVFIIVRNRVVRRSDPFAKKKKSNKGIVIWFFFYWRRDDYREILTTGEEQTLGFHDFPTVFFAPSQISYYIMTIFYQCHTKNIHVHLIVPRIFLNIPLILTENYLVTNFIYILIFY